MVGGARGRATAAVLVAALLALTALPAAAQESEGTGGIRGTVETEGCEAAAGVEVLAVAPDGDVAAEDVTDDDGAFVLDGLDAGEHQVVAGALAPAYETATAQVRVTEGRTATADLVLPAVTVPADRVAGGTRVTTAVAASRRAYPDGAPAVVIAASGAFPDALAAAPLAARAGGPLLLVDRRSGPDVLEEVRRLGASEAVIVGAIGGVTAVVGSELLAGGVEVRRIAGENRIDTAALVARELGASEGGEVAIATGFSFADALSFAPLAAAEGIPVLLTGGDDLAGETAEAIEAIGATEAIVLGGPQAVSDDVLDDLPSATRVFGFDRYATSVAIAELAVERGADLGTAYVATGADYPDALAAGPVAAATAGPLLLVDGQDDRSVQPAARFLAGVLDEVEGVVGFGGELAVSDAVLDRIAAPGDGLACDTDDDR